jgi:hypothetical protein
MRVSLSEWRQGNVWVLMYLRDGAYVPGKIFREGALLRSILGKSSILIVRKGGLDVQSILVQLAHI